MDLTAFTELLKSEFIDANNIELTPTTKFRDIGSWDSLTGMSINILIEEQFGVIISESEFKACATTTELYQIILANKA
jgi:acyl carrier protein